MRLDKWLDDDREAPEPLEGNVVATITVITLAWCALFLVQIPFYGWYADHGHTWWLWTCLAAGSLGFVGVWYVRRRDAAIRRDAAGRSAPDTAPDPRPEQSPPPDQG